MADVKWIKIVTDIFDDEKIFLIEQLPEADSIIVLWFKLLCLAGKQNNRGVFTLCESMPYTDEMFSAVFRRPLNTVRLALKTFENFGMVQLINGTVTIPNWAKHQNIEGMEKRQEYMRVYMQNYRDEQKLLAGSKQQRKCLRKQNVSDTDIDLEVDTDKSISGATAPTRTKEKYGEYGWVKLTDAEHDKLLKDLGVTEFQRCLHYVDESAQTSGNKNRWKDWNLVIRKCNRDKWGMNGKADEQEQVVSGWVRQ